MERTCRNCVFFEREEVMGACHRYPPIPKQGFTTVGELSWCGEFKEPIEDASVPVKVKSKSGSG